MKKFRIVKNLTYICVVVSLYIIISFVTLEFNPINWGWFGRLVLICFAFGSLGIIFED